MIPFIKPLPGSGNHLQDQKDDELEEESRREDETCLPEENEGA
jgi:hypothetical protein